MGDYSHFYNTEQDWAVIFKEIQDEIDKEEEEAK